MSASVDSAIGSSSSDSIRSGASSLATDANSSSSSGVSSITEDMSHNSTNERPNVNGNMGSEKEETDSRQDSGSSTVTLDRQRLRSGRRWLAKEELEVIKKVEGISSHKVEV